MRPGRPLRPRSRRLRRPHGRRRRRPLPPRRRAPCGCAAPASRMIRARAPRPPPWCRTPGTCRHRRSRSPRPSPKVDCFYVYPTVSDQKTPIANRHIDPEERADRAHAGVALLAGVPGVRADLPPGHARRDQRRNRAEREEREDQHRRRLPRRARGVERLSRARQRRPRGGAARAFAGIRRAHPAHAERDRSEAGRAAPARVGRDPRRQRHGEAGKRPGRRLRAHPGVPVVHADRLRRGVLQLLGAAAREFVVRAAGHRPACRRRPRAVAYRCCA